MAKILDEGIQKQVREVFADLEHPIEVIFFKRREACDYCEDTQSLLQEVIDLSDKLELTVYDLDDNAEQAADFGIDKTPAFVIAARDGEERIDYGIRFYGIPAGHEFTSLINTLMLVSRRESGLSAQTKAYLAGLTQPVHLQVFVTPT